MRDVPDASLAHCQALNIPSAELCRACTRRRLQLTRRCDIIGISTAVRRPRWWRHVRQRRSFLRPKLALSVPGGPQVSPPHVAHLGKKTDVDGGVMAAVAPAISDALPTPPGHGADSAAIARLSPAQLANQVCTCRCVYAVQVVRYFTMTAVCMLAAGLPLGVPALALAHAVCARYPYVSVRRYLVPVQAVMNRDSWSTSACRRRWGRGSLSSAATPRSCAPIKTCCRAYHATRCWLHSTPRVA